MSTDTVWSPEVQAQLDEALPFSATPNGCIEALTDLASAMQALEEAGQLSEAEREFLGAELRSWMPPAIARCLALAAAGMEDESLRALKSEPFDEAEGKRFMELIHGILTVMEDSPERLSELIAASALAPA